MSDTLNWKRIRLFIVLAKQKWKKKNATVNTVGSTSQLYILLRRKTQQKRLLYSLGNLRAKETGRIFLKLGRPSDLSVTCLDPLFWISHSFPKHARVGWQENDFTCTTTFGLPPATPVWFAQSIQAAVSEMNWSEKTADWGPGRGRGFVIRVTAEKGSMTIRKAGCAPMKPSHKARGRELIHAVPTVCKEIFLSSSPSF